MEKLVRGLHHFQATHFRAHRELFERLSGGQTPETLLITCSDSRVAPELVLQAMPGELFVLRNAGNIVPAFGAANGGEGATIEYAVKALQIRHIVVMGHSHCGAMQGLLHDELVQDMPLVASWLNHAAATREIVRGCYADAAGGDLWTAAIKENVLVQLDNLRTYPSVAARLARNEIWLHGWVYEFESGHVYAYDPARTQFALLEMPEAPPAISTRVPAVTRMNPGR
ncbi:MAG: carbonic anhydrase [Gammaproteobacteria bacterium]